jgi:hypothetical protein
MPPAPTRATRRKALRSMISFGSRSRPISSETDSGTLVEGGKIAAPMSALRNRRRT